MRPFLAILLSALIAGGPAFAERRRPSTASESLPPAAPMPEALVDADLRIDNVLASVASSTRQTRYVLGGVLFAASLYVSGVYIAQDRFAKGDVAYVAKGIVGVTGLIFAASGIGTFILPGEAEKAGARYHLISARTERQLRDKVIFGESELRRLSERAATTRSIVGGLFGAVGFADLVWFLGTGPNHELNFLAYLGGLYLGFGALFILLRSPAEREYDDHIRFDVRPLPNGAAAGISWSF